MVFETVSNMIAKQLKVDLSRVVPEAKLVEDLGADSANIMVLIMDLEDEYDMQVDDSAITELHTVGDVVSYIEELTQA
ncbi:MAG: acyl carrier protein [Christensenellales bacterium]|mgnify:CR=1 FL=1|jgi:acyl carrier protein|nr:acyl carrier protein [Christensenellaceae bacterium]